MSVGSASGSQVTLTPKGIGLPDYSQSKPLGAVPVSSSSPVYTLTDSAELARRLGSVNTFDGRGYTLWYDDFEGGAVNTRWTVSGTVVRSADYCRNGTYSCKMTAAAGNDSTIVKLLPYPVASRIGVEFSYMGDASAYPVSLTIGLYDRTYWHYAQARYNIATTTLDVRTGVASFTGISTGLTLPNYSTLFNTIKLVVDFSSSGHLYERILANSLASNISANSYYRVADASTGPYLQIIIGFTNTHGVDSKSIYVDDVIVTQQEQANAAS